MSCGSITIAAVLINGGTAKALLSRLGFLSYTPEQLATLRHVVQDMVRMGCMQTCIIHAYTKQADTNAASLPSRCCTQAVMCIL
jgi:hypothetical protein